ncbi:glycosyltransferase [Aliivibrio fischeri]|uniref:glycosyltransferase n=1 Tax=Aliivibrio fischeri TaxID=668 RepID=UPI0012DA7611|nr:glycosyltransferase [Aliivibrio fischeri]MUK67956.1 glycosyltransferase [Aliivibrio fischeri]MUK72903.1 glycosyltransferase [Aliivibrio fischeri]
MEIKKLLAPFNEGEIKKYWKYTDKVYVSCVCITFNQKDYIRDALDGFLAQKTEYRFEIIIHDDVSTDGTRDILFEYKEKYPSIIKLVLQDENQYKQGKKITPLAVSYASGEYIALCEGDDFWISNKKIQKQTEMLELYENINLCTHNAHFIDEKCNILSHQFNKILRKDRYISYRHVFSSNGQFCPTASMFFRRELLDNQPSFYSKSPFGDFALEVITGQCGIINIGSIFSVYRYQLSSQNWSSINLSTIDKKINITKLGISNLDLIFDYLPFNKKWMIYLRRSNLFFNLALINAERGNKKKAIFFYIRSLFIKTKISRNDFYFICKMMSSK